MESQNSLHITILPGALNTVLIQFIQSFVLLLKMHIPSPEIGIIFNLDRLEISLPPSFIRIQESVSFTFMDLQVFLLLFQFFEIPTYGINFIKTQSNVGGYLGLYLGVSLVEVQEMAYMSKNIKSSSSQYLFSWRMQRESLLRLSPT